MQIRADLLWIFLIACPKHVPVPPDRANQGHFRGENGKTAFFQPLPLYQPSPLCSFHPSSPQLSLYLQQALKSYPCPPPALIPPSPAAILAPDGHHKGSTGHQKAIKSPTAAGPAASPWAKSAFWPRNLPRGARGQTPSCTPSCWRAPGPLYEQGFKPGVTAEKMKGIWC